MGAGRCELCTNWPCQFASAFEAAIKSKNLDNLKAIGRNVGFRKKCSDRKRLGQIYKSIVIMPETAEDISEVLAAINSQNTL